MTRQEIAEFLMRARIIDERIMINEPALASWEALLPEWLSLDLALLALRDHYQTSDKRIMPANIINLARPKRQIEPERLPEVECEPCNGTGFIISEAEDGYRRANYCTCAAGRQMRRWHGK